MNSLSYKSMFITNKLNNREAFTSLLVYPVSLTSIITERI